MRITEQGPLSTTRHLNISQPGLTTGLKSEESEEEVCPQAFIGKKAMWISPQTELKIIHIKKRLRFTKQKCCVHDLLLKLYRCISLVIWYQNYWIPLTIAPVKFLISLYMLILFVISSWHKPYCVDISLRNLSRLLNWLATTLIPRVAGILDVWSAVHMAKPFFSNRVSSFLFFTPESNCLLMKSLTRKKQSIIHSFSIIKAIFLFTSRSDIRNARL